MDGGQLAARAHEAEQREEGDAEPEGAFMQEAQVYVEGKHHGEDDDLDDGDDVEGAESSFCHVPPSALEVSTENWYYV